MAKSANTRKAAAASYPVRVCCRVMPLPKHSGASCVQVLNTTSIILTTPPESQKRQRQRETRHVFKHVFAPDAIQHEVFATSALPLTEELIRGHNSVLLAYGITGSGKTYTMTGTKKHRGILPRCLDLVFRTISDYQTARFVFKPDRANGFAVQSYEAALKERMKKAPKHSYRKKRSRTRAGNNSVMEVASLPSRNEESLCISQLDEDNMYAVFVTYIEVYNNVVYDLLEEDNAKKGLRQKIIREDFLHNTMYVPGTIEVEVKSADEAIRVFRQGQQRKRMAETKLNVESSRSHTVFNIRLVQAPFDQQGEYVLGGKGNITISQLSLVDLAGSERYCRSKNTGKRLREAGNINKSLMTLRSCLKFLREKQLGQLGPSAKNLPYRQSKITHLFKKFFDGEGQIAMIVCINPSAENYDENMQVMEFAEMSQKIEISRVKHHNSKTNLFSTHDLKATTNELKLDVNDYEGDISEIIKEHQRSFFSDAIVEQLMLDMADCPQGNDTFKQRCGDLAIQLLKAKEENTELHKQLSTIRSTYSKAQSRVTLLEEVMENLEIGLKEQHNRLGRIKSKVKRRNAEIRKLLEAKIEQKRQYQRYVEEIIDTINVELDKNSQTPGPSCRSIKPLPYLSTRSRCSCCSSVRAENGRRHRPKLRRMLPEKIPRYNVRHCGRTTRRPRHIERRPNSFVENNCELTTNRNYTSCESVSLDGTDCEKAFLALWGWCNEE